MGKNVTQKLIEAHLVHGNIVAGEEIGIRIDQTLMQDATGTMVMLEFEALEIERIKNDIAVQYVDHNLLQTDHRNADDHLFLRSACQKFGIHFSRPGNGVSHAVHMERFGVPGATLLGSDSHSCSGGSMGMLAIGAGGLEVALAMAAEPFYFKMPKIRGVKLVGKLSQWVSTKDIILELLRRHGVKGGVGKIFEYYGPGLDTLPAMDRHTIANMGAELGATTSVFPSDATLREFLVKQHRDESFREILADKDATYDEYEEIDLSTLEPFIALPGSPGNVVPVREVAGKEIYQSYIGSSANPGLRDIAIVAMIIDGKLVHDKVSLDINPASRQVLETLSAIGLLEKLIHSGARIHQAGCNGCIGMGQAPASGKISLRTVPRNFPGRSGTAGDQVYLCSPETAVVSAITGVITDPRSFSGEYPQFIDPQEYKVNTTMILEPPQDSSSVVIEKGPNIKPLPKFNPLANRFEIPILLKTGDNVSTDEILPAGAKVLPFRSNIPEISKFAFSRIDESFYERTGPYRESGFVVVGGENYGQGSSREHAALAPRYLGLRVVIAKSFARIHWQNLVNFGIIPLTFSDPLQYDTIDQYDTLVIEDLWGQINSGSVLVCNVTKQLQLTTVHTLSDRQKASIRAGSLINVVRDRR